MVATLLAFVLTFEGIYHFGQDGISAWGTGLITTYNLFFILLQEQWSGSVTG